MTKLNGLTSGFVAIDIEKFCRVNLREINADLPPKSKIYQIAVNGVLLEILNTYFGGK